MMERGHRRFQCANVMDAVEDDAAEENDQRSRKGVGIVAKAGTCLAFGGVLIAAPRVLRESFCESAGLEARWVARRRASSGC